MEIPFFEGDTPVNRKLILMACTAFLAVSPAAFSMDSDGEGGDGSSGRSQSFSSKPTPADLREQADHLDRLHVAVKAGKPVWEVHNGLLVADLNKAVGAFRTAVAQAVQKNRGDFDKAMRMPGKLQTDHHDLVPTLLEWRDEGLYGHVSKGVEDAVASLTEMFGHMAEGDAKDFGAKMKDIRQHAAEAHLAAVRAGAYDDGEEE